ncbi:MAG TPA: 6-phosphogluconolactonase [Kiritimatiellia bacterium]|nr:6-phosphogluconolactonase [Kiritimatiellia bacterium]
MIKHCIYPSAESVATGLATAILKAFDRAEMIDGPVAIMLAGGRTPKAAYEIVARSGRIIPENMTLMISDERWVPLDSPESNFLMMTPFMKAVKCAEIQKIMVNTALPREEAAKDFGRRLDSFFNRGGILLESFLGLGADGHTASLFSDDHLTKSQNTSAIAVDRPDGRVGISATASTIQKAQRVVFVVTGADKKNMADLLLTRPLDLTAGKVVFRHAHVELWRDKAAV